MVLFANSESETSSLLRFLKTAENCLSTKPVLILKSGRLRGVFQERGERGMGNF